jgi:hypothetical protein
MAIYNVDQVVAFRVDDEIVCRDCLAAEERKELTEDRIITEEELVDSYAFCDRCKSSLD